MKIVSSNWQKNLEEDAIRFADEVRRLISVRMQQSSKHIPNKADREAATTLVNMYFDALIGTICMVGQTFNGGLPKDFEDSVIEGIRYKFSVLRERMLSGKEGEQSKAPINPSGG